MISSKRFDDQGSAFGILDFKVVGIAASNLHPEDAFVKLADFTEAICVENNRIESHNFFKPFRFENQPLLAQNLTP